jgi:hypothetical protein
MDQIGQGKSTLGKPTVHGLSSGLKGLEKLVFRILSGVEELPLLEINPFPQAVRNQSALDLFDFLKPLLTVTLTQE